MKYALIENNVVKIISYQKIDGYVEVADDVFPEMVKDGSNYDYTDEHKSLQTQGNEIKAQKETDRANGKKKLKDLGLTDAEVSALIGE
mgnify:CR=1 FL=1|tara:strand:- start:366 stop:629 length:264 start_codon:yes stop_codon:yes gene_type:complete